MAAQERQRTRSTEVAGEDCLVAVRQSFLEEGGTGEDGRDNPGGCEGGIRPEEGRTSQTLN